MNRVGSIFAQLLEYRLVFRGNRSVTVAALIGAARKQAVFRYIGELLNSVLN
jgi:hypothetical protein